MTEEAVVENQDTPPETPPEPSDVERLAREIGWNPNYEGKGAKTAEEYILASRGFQDRLREGWDAERKKLTQLEQSIKEMGAHFKQAIENERATAIKTIQALKKERKEAIESGDVERVDDIEQQIQAESRKTAVPKKTTVPPEIAKWKKENEWFDEEPDMRAYAIGLDDEGVPLEDISKRVEKMFPNYFKKPEPKPKAPTVEGAGKPPAPKAKQSLKMNDLTPQERQMAQDFVNSGLFNNIDEYLKAVSKEEV